MDLYRILFVISLMKWFVKNEGRKLLTLRSNLDKGGFKAREELLMMCRGFEDVLNKFTDLLRHFLTNTEDIVGDLGQMISDELKEVIDLCPSHVYRDQIKMGLPEGTIIYRTEEPEHPEE